MRFIETALLNLDAEALYDTGLLSKEITYESAFPLITPRTPLWKGSKFTAAAHISGRLNESFEYSVTPYFVHHGKQKLTHQLSNITITHQLSNISKQTMPPPGSLH